MIASVGGITKWFKILIACNGASEIFFSQAYNRLQHLVLSAFEQLRLCNLMMKDQRGLLRVCAAPDNLQLVITAKGFWQASSEMERWPGWHASFHGQIADIGGCKCYLLKKRRLP